MVRPALTALQVYGEERARVEGARPALQTQVSELAGTIPPNAIQDALQRQQERNAPPPVIQHPQTQADWVTVMRQQAIQAEGRQMQTREHMQFTALQRQVAQRLAQGLRTDRQPAAQRYAEYAGHLVSLQRHPISGQVASAVMTMIPQGERPALQRAVDEVLQREATERKQDEAALNLHTLQRQLAELDQQATQPVFERIRARRGAGNPLPEAVQRHLEQGLNHDLSGVRIHDDAEADKLAKGVKAIAFTTGKDIFFQAGKFNPNTQSGLELLAHEVTHTVQQSKGQVGHGIDPSASHETEAQDMGRKLAVMPSPKSLIPPVPHKNGPYAPGVYNQKAATQRIQSGAANHALLNPLRALQRQPDLTIQRSFVGDKLSELAQNIPGYKPLTMALGYDPVAGKAIPANPNALLDALGNFVPGPFKDMVKVIREQKLVDKAWTWFKAELSKLQLGKVITDIKDALSGLPNISKAKSILETAASKVKNLVTGSARKLAEIAITAITAGLGPVGKRIMASLAQAGDVITQVLKNPGQFAKNLMNALKQGFTGFVTRSATWLQKGLGDFLTGSANIQMPKNLNVEGVLMTALSIMDLTYDALRGRLIKELGSGAEKKIAMLETAGGALGQLKGGVGKAPEMKSIAGKIGGEVLGGIKTEVTETLVKKGIAKVALMFNPAGAAIGAIMAAWSTIQTVIDKGKQIMGVIMNALSSIREIAAGNVAGAASFIEQTVGKALPVVFSFAANFLGIGNIGTRIRNLVKGMRQKLGIDKFIDGIIARLKKIVGVGKTLVTNGIQQGRDAANKVISTLKGIITPKEQFQVGKEKHSVWVEMKSNQPVIMVASTPADAMTHLVGLRQKCIALGVHEKPGVKAGLASAASTINTEKRRINNAIGQSGKNQNLGTGAADAEKQAKSVVKTVKAALITVYAAIEETEKTNHAISIKGKVLSDRELNVIILEAVHASKAFKKFQGEESKYSTEVGKQLQANKPLPGHQNVTIHVTLEPGESLGSIYAAAKKVKDKYHLQVTLQVQMIHSDTSGKNTRPNIELVTVGGSRLQSADKRIAVFVHGGGSYSVPDGKHHKSVELAYPMIQELCRQAKVSESDLATSLLKFPTTHRIPIELKKYKEKVAKLISLMSGVETSRGATNLATLPMMLRMVADGDMSFKEAFEGKQFSSKRGGDYPFSMGGGESGAKILESQLSNALTSGSKNFSQKSTANSKEFEKRTAAIARKWLAENGRKDYVGKPELVVALLKLIDAGSEA